MQIRRQLVGARNSKTQFAGKVKVAPHYRAGISDGGKLGEGRFTQYVDYLHAEDPRAEVRLDPKCSHWIHSIMLALRLLRTSGLCRVSYQAGSAARPISSKRIWTAACMLRAHAM